MSKKIFLIVVLLLVTLICAPARADLDQLCLKQCVNNSLPKSACMTQCTFGPSPKPIVAPSVAPIMPEPTAPPVSTHRVLDTPLPIGDQVILKHPQTPPAPAKDYACFNQCLHGGQNYSLCEGQCTKVPCETGSVSCSNLTGTVIGTSAAH